jgi:2'-5' RNA ligase
VRQDLLHITINAVGDHPALPFDIIDAAHAAGGRVRFETFEARFDRIGSYTGSRSASGLITMQGDAGVLAIIRLQRVLAEQMCGAGIGAYVRRSWFTPHVSLLYDARPVAQRLVRPVRWMVRKLLLVHSDVGRSRHNLLGEWALLG